MIRQIVIDPGHGHSSETGEYDLGTVVPGLTELDCIDIYGRTLVDTLIERNIRTVVLQTRKRPGYRPIERAAEIPEDSLVLSLHMGTAGKLSGFNRGQIYAKDTESKTALVCAHVLQRWGRSVSTTHQLEPVVEARFPVLAFAVDGVHIEPFELDGPDAAVMARSLARFGTTLGRELADFLRFEHPGCVIGISQAPVPPPPSAR